MTTSSPTVSRLLAVLLFILTHATFANGLRKHGKSRYDPLQRLFNLEKRVHGRRHKKKLSNAMMDYEDRIDSDYDDYKLALREFSQLKSNAIEERYFEEEGGEEDAAANGPDCDIIGTIEHYKNNKDDSSKLRKLLPEFYQCSKSFRTKLLQTKSKKSSSQSTKGSTPPKKSSTQPKEDSDVCKDQFNQILKEKDTDWCQTVFKNSVPLKCGASKYKIYPFKQNQPWYEFDCGQESHLPNTPVSIRVCDGEAKEQCYPYLLRQVGDDPEMTPYYLPIKDCDIIGTKEYYAAIKADPDALRDLSPNFNKCSTSFLTELLEPITIETKELFHVCSSHFKKLLKYKSAGTCQHVFEDKYDTPLKCEKSEYEIYPFSMKEGWDGNHCDPPGGSANKPVPIRICKKPQCYPYLLKQQSEGPANDYVAMKLAKYLREALPSQYKGQEKAPIIRAFDTVPQYGPDDERWDNKKVAPMREMYFFSLFDFTHDGNWIKTVSPNKAIVPYFTALKKDEHKDGDPFVFRDRCSCKPEYKENLLRSLRGSFLMQILLGARDRHDGNCAITKDCMVTNIDYGHFLGRKADLEGSYTTMYNDFLSVYLSKIGEEENFKKALFDDIKKVQSLWNGIEATDNWIEHSRKWFKVAYNRRDDCSDKVVDYMEKFLTVGEGGFEQFSAVMDQDKAPVFSKMRAHLKNQESVWCAIGCFLKPGAVFYSPEYHKDGCDEKKKKYDSSVIYRYPDRRCTHGEIQIEGLSENKLKCPK